jgi:hypothetical protein
LTHNGTNGIITLKLIYKVVGLIYEVMYLQKDKIKINDEFQEIDTRTIDSRNRLTIGDLAQGFNRVRLYKNELGEILLKPVVEIPASELWLFQNKEALEDVQKGSKDLSEGKITKLDIDKL